MAQTLIALATDEANCNIQLQQELYQGTWHVMQDIPADRFNHPLTNHIYDHFIKEKSLKTQKKPKKAAGEQALEGPVEGTAT